MEGFLGRLGDDALAACRTALAGVGLRSSRLRLAREVARRPAHGGPMRFVADARDPIPSCAKAARRDPRRGARWNEPRREGDAAHDEEGKKPLHARDPDMPTQAPPILRRLPWDPSVRLARGDPCRRSWRWAAA